MAHASFQKPIEDIVECPICMETLKNTRVLPCIHTFCLRCIKKHGKGKKPGDTAQCPYCRKEYPVPLGGFDKMPKNTFIEKLLEVQCTLTTEWSNSSTICTFPGHGQKSKTQSLAIWYCVECKRQMCGGCRSVHLRPGGTSFHHVLPVQKESPCLEHPYKQLDRFCKTCKTPVCGECCASNHRGHDWSTLVNYVGVQQVELEKLIFNNTKPSSQPNKQERELRVPFDVLYNAVRSQQQFANRVKAIAEEVQNKVFEFTVGVAKLKLLLIEEQIKVAKLTAEDKRFTSRLREGQNRVFTLTIVVILLLAFCWQSRDWMNEERARWSFEKYNCTLSEEILTRQIEKLTVQMDEERASCLSEKRRNSEDKT